MAVSINFFSAPQLNNIPKSSIRQDNTYEPAKNGSNDFRNHLNQASASNKSRIKPDIRAKRFDNLKKVDDSYEKDSKLQNISKNLNAYNQSKTVSKIDTKAEDVNELKDDDVKELSGEEQEILKNLLATLQSSNLPTIVAEINEENLVANCEEDNKNLMDIISEVQQKIAGLPINSDESLKRAIDNLKQLIEASTDSKSVNTNITNNQSVVGIEQAKIALIQNLESIINDSKRSTVNSNQLNVQGTEETVTLNDVMVKKDAKPLFQDQRYKVNLNTSSDTQDLNSDVKAVEQKNNLSDLDSESEDNSSIDSNEITDIDKVSTQSNKTDEAFPTKIDGIQKEINIKNVDEVAKIVKTAEIPKTEIIKQIVRKAEVVLKDGKSEMSMKLEPENLGKLSLKIAIEKGIVTAKFVTENQEVKQTIESNFNQLKDMLHEKGITVQSFSVSVGHEGSEFNSKNNLNIWKETIEDNKKAFIGEDYIDMDGYESMSKINPYNYHDGKIDFKA